MTTAPSSPGTPSCATNRAWPRISPTRTARGGAAATRTGTASSAATRPNARPSPPPWHANRRRPSTNRQQAHANARLPHPAEAFADELLELQDQQGAALLNRYRVVKTCAGKLLEL